MADNYTKWDLDWKCSICGVPAKDTVALFEQYFSSVRRVKISRIQTMLIGFYVQIVLLGTIGCVLYQCLQLTRNCYFHFCVQNVSRRAALSWKTERDSK